MAELASRLDDLRDLERELSMAQRWVQGRLTDVQRELAEAADGNGDQLTAEVLAALAGDVRTASTLSREIEVPQQLVESVLTALEADGIVARNEHGWRIRE